MIIVFTIMACIAVFVIHYKNWIAFKEGIFGIASGIYTQEIPVSKINTIVFVQRLPKMKRKNGFSWMAREKGIYFDSISGQETKVFIDDLRQRKLRLTYNDSLVLYFNLSDSLETLKYYEILSFHIMTQR